ncbi:hypothetical protein D1007_45109 [Hordeum vulgare]|nr:hypothetical protein D1007_45109 [Hordeum vulgare]
MPRRSNSLLSCRSARQPRRRATKVEAVHHEKEQDRLLRRLSCQTCPDDSDLMCGSTSRSEDNVPMYVDAYMKEGHGRVGDRNHKGKGPARKWLFPPPFPVYLYFK